LGYGEKSDVDQETLEEIIRRIVQVAQPERIILFGSAARGEMKPHSDVDLLVGRREAEERAGRAIGYGEEQVIYGDV